MGTKETRELCMKFMQDPHEISVDQEFNQVVIFVKSVQRAIALDKLLVECSFPSLSIHSGLNQEERINRYKQFKEFQKRIMVCTDLFGRGIDIERVNIVIN